MWEAGPPQVNEMLAPLGAASPPAVPVQSTASPLFISQYKSWKKASMPSTFSCCFPSPPASVTQWGSSSEGHVLASGGSHLALGGAVRGQSKSRWSPS